MAKEKGLTYVKLDGNVGILANGAGLCMSTLDVVAQAGGDARQLPRRRRRLQGRGDRRRARGDHLRREGEGDPLQHLRRHHPRRRGRQGHRRGLEQIDLELPLVVRLDGTNSEEGLQILAEADLANLHQEKTMLDAAAQGRRAGEEACMSDHRRRRHEARRLRPHRPRGHLPRPAQPRLRHRPRRRRHARQGRPGRRGRPGLRLDRRGGRRGGRQHLDDLRPGALRRRRRSTRRSTPASRR